MKTTIVPHKCGRCGQTMDLRLEVLTGTSQAQRHPVTCPACGDTDRPLLPSAIIAAPRLN